MKFHAWIFRRREVPERCGASPSQLGEVSGGCPIRQTDGGRSASGERAAFGWPFSGGLLV
uniref:Uncharacterized protein n=1 Tax=Solanum lycopersicum TaxID=4081 RepID=A0A3Q7EAM3_SOLLC